MLHQAPAARTVTAPFGPDLGAATAEAVDALKDGRPLAPVTVVVARTLVAVDLRRGTSAARGGLANVDFRTASSFARALVAPAACRADPPTQLAAARAALAARGGHLGASAGHTATHRGMVRTYRALKAAGPDARDRLAVDGSPRARALLAVFDDMAARLAGRRDDADDLWDACAHLDAGGDPGTGVVVVCTDLPDHAELALLSRLAARDRTRVVLATTGDEVADAPWAEAFGMAIAPAPPPAPTAVIDAPDPAAEVAAVVRRVIARVADGTDPSRIAIAYPDTGPYLRLIREHLARTHLPWTAPSPETLGTTMPGRVLARIVDLATATAPRFSRRGVVDLVASGPLGATTVPAARVDDLSRRAGVVAGVDEWRKRLAALRAACVVEVEARTRRDVGAAAIRAAQRDIDDIDRLDALVARLDARCAELGEARGWRQRAAWLGDSLDALVGDADDDPAMPHGVRDARAALEDAIARLGELDQIEGPPSTDTFVAAVGALLAAPAPREIGGPGVRVVPLAAAAGLDLDTVLVTGLNDGVCPSIAADDPFLDERDRAILFGDAPRGRRGAVDAQRRSLLAVLAGASRDRILSCARADPRRGRPLSASRWLVELLSAPRPAAPLRVSDFPTVDHPLVERVGVVEPHTEHFIDLADRDVHEASRAAERALPATAVAVLADGGAAGRGRATIVARDGSVATEFDGMIGPGSSDLDGPLSATRLETWASCPARYFYEYVLRVDPVPTPERAVDLDALDRGALVHRILEDFLGEVVERGSHPGVPWSADDHARLMAIAESRFAEVAASGAGGRRLNWIRRTREIRRDLTRWLRDDAGVRDAIGSVPESVELPVGVHGSRPVELTLPSGRRIQLRGYADRVDRGPSGEAVVFDYKTGTTPRQRELDDDPTASGTCLQLGVYASAVRGDHADPPHAYYWRVPAEGSDPLAGYRFGPEVRDRFLRVLDEIVEGIEAGRFPMNPGARNHHFGGHDGCRRCPYDPICPAERVAQVEAKAIAVPVSPPTRRVGDDHDLDRVAA